MYQTKTHLVLQSSSEQFVLVHITQLPNPTHSPKHPPHCTEHRDRAVVLGVPCGAAPELRVSLKLCEVSSISRRPLQVARALPISRPAGHRSSRVGQNLNRRPHCGSATHAAHLDRCGCAVGPAQAATPSRKLRQRGISAEPHRFVNDNRRARASDLPGRNAP